MAKKPTPAPISRGPAKAPVRPAAPVASAVRNSAVPRPQAPAKKEITYEMIAKRAYEIHLSGKGGSQDDNWFRAERELSGQ